MLGAKSMSPAHTAAAARYLRGSCFSLRNRLNVVFEWDRARPISFNTSAFVHFPIDPQASGGGGNARKK